MGPFEAEEEGTGVASDIVQANGEDSDTPGYLRGEGEVGMSEISDCGCVSLGSLTMKPRDRT